MAWQWLRSPALLLWASALQLVRRGLAGDTVDLNVLLYNDPNCFSRSDEMVLVDKGCYANRYANTTKSFELKIVVFEGDEKIALRGICRRVLRCVWFTSAVRRLRGLYLLSYLCS